MLFPLSNTTSIEIRKFQNDFIVRENVLKLYKKVVVKNIIKNNLYFAATDVGVRLILLNLQKFWI